MTQATTQARIRQITARELKSMLDDGLFPFLAQGFTNTCNLVGSTDAWSVAVDPSVCCY